MCLTTTLSIGTILVGGAAFQRDDKFSATLVFVDLIVIAMTAEMMASGIHCNKIGHDGQHDEEKGGELHC